jgi:thimet oligopeptidase
LNTSYPVVFPIFEYCTVASTREKLWRLNANKAYPENQSILNEIIKKRDELAKLLGYKSYAQYDIDDEMAQTPEHVEQFLNNLIARTNKKELEEHELLKTDLPASVKLSADDKFYPWDRLHALAMYKKKHFNIDQREIAQYFPMKSTIQGLLDIYRNFFGIEFKELPISGMWDPEIQLIEVTSKENNQVLGYLLLDLYPRSNKYNHACQATIIPAIQKLDEIQQPALVLVIANFPKPTTQEPSLLELNEVNTFFHEFGHALHSILGVTPLAGTSGTRVKTDFVELPSQMLEEWLADAGILKQLSKHYQTGQPMPDNLINAIIDQKNFSIGSYIQRQVYLAFISLLMFQEGGVADTQELARDLSKKIRIHSIFDNTDHFEVSFGHLMGYAAKYYSYLWSKVFALDLFYTIKEHGLLNSEIGKKYAQTILMPGGSVDPNELLRNFLGREPNSDAFFKDLGL